MGLDITPGGAHWSYHGFMHFRERLAKEEGIELIEMEGFEGLKRGRDMDRLLAMGILAPPETPGSKPWENEDGEYITVLAPLLNHSDCDGYLDPWECEEMLPRLREIASTWSNRDPAEDDSDVTQLYNLIHGMEHCVHHGCAMVFH